MSQITHAEVAAFFVHLKEHGIFPTLEKYYAENATLGEAGQPANVGLEAIKKVEAGFAGALKPEGKFLDVVVHTIVVENNNAAIEHSLKFQFGDGTVVEQIQLSLQQWKDGKIVKETFYGVKK